MTCIAILGNNGDCVIGDICAQKSIDTKLIFQKNIYVERECRRKNLFFFILRAVLKMFLTVAWYLKQQYLKQ